mmetsp:Transcript_9250/g.13704  ORF Transcript_9250/g.13704 Transcript_9250/m.13704 type:complete len:96 (-) Transcript_9250:558-845(-)
MIPINFRHDSKMVLWCLRLQKECKSKIDVKTISYQNLEKQAQENGAILAKMIEDHECVAREVMELEKGRPIRYIKLKKKMKGLYFRCSQKIDHGK